jgi:hypothetical protein
MPSTNQRSDRYGGPIVQRMNFVMELVEALTQAFERDRVGIRLSPFPHGLRGNVYHEVPTSLNDQEIAYIHRELTDPLSARVLKSSPSTKALRRAYPGIFYRERPARPSVWDGASGKSLGRRRLLSWSADRCAILEPTAAIAPGQYRPVIRGRAWRRRRPRSVACPAAKNGSSRNPVRLVCSSFADASRFFTTIYENRVGWACTSLGVHVCLYRTAGSVGR